VAIDIGSQRVRNSQSSKGVALHVGDKDKSKIDYCINRTFDSSIATVCRMSLLVTLGFIVIVVVRRWWGPRISSGDRDPPVVATSPTSHRGVSLIELMVVVSIIGVLAGLILSSVQMVRSTAVRTTCQNNLRQIAIGTLASHDVLGSFPAGLSYQSEHHRFKYMGWTARILPFIEQDIIWADIEKTFRSDPNPEDLFGCRDQERLLNTRIKAFVCPSDGHDRIHRSRYFDPGFTWYLGNHGTDHAKLDGILFKDSRVRISDIADGTTNTILIGERPPAQSGQFGWWYRGLGQRKDGSADMILSVRELNVYFPNCPPGPYSFVRGNPENNCDSFHFWSLHPNGANFVMADGSVKLLAYSVDHLMPILATRSGREVVPNLD
jgi:prepilin-type N-terminal cleavage/methylation domain-containing protein/prepilin-type processing-associated H-X9-DG protein